MTPDPTPDAPSSQHLDGRPEQRPDGRPEQCTATRMEDVDMEHLIECPNCMCPVLVMGTRHSGPSPTQPIETHTILCPNCMRQTHPFSTPEAAVVAWQTQYTPMCHCLRCNRHLREAAASMGGRVPMDLLAYPGEPEMQHEQFEVV